jgi:hypothetical protein
LVTVSSTEGEFWSFLGPFFLLLFLLFLGGFDCFSCLNRLSLDLSFHYSWRWSIGHCFFRGRWVL